MELTDEEIRGLATNLVANYSHLSKFIIKHYEQQAELTRLREERATLRDRVKVLQGENEKAFISGYKDACEMHSDYGFNDCCQAELDLALKERKKS